MAYAFNTNYYIVSHAGTGKCLNIYGNEQVSNNRNVCLWTQDATNAQNWLIKSFATGIKIVSALNQSYALNYHWTNGQGAPGNCDIYPESGNDVDSCVIIQPVDVANNIYRIKLKNYNLYMTANGAGDGAEVTWDGEDTTNAGQRWKFVLFSTSGTTTDENSLCMPQNLNQKYTGFDSVIQTAGCAVCCACDVASYYGGSNYSLEQMKTYGVYTASDPTCHWGNVPSAGFNSKTNGLTQTQYFDRIRSEINAGRPVVVYMVGSYQHYVVAYGYTGAGNSNSTIKVLDPCNLANTASKIGRDITLDVALAGQGATQIAWINTTYAK